MTTLHGVLYCNPVNAPAGVIRMTEIGRSNRGLLHAAFPSLREGHKFDIHLDALLDALTKSLDLASRGYCCASNPIEEPDPPYVSPKEKPNENVPGK